MVILKVFNNNSVVALSEDKQDIILTGPGIGFKKKPGDLVDENKIEKRYVFQDEQLKRLESSLNKIPVIYFEITEQIIKKARKYLETDFSSEVFITISDHISFAMKRYQENVYLPNIILNETKILYKKEFEVGLWAIRYIFKKTRILLDENEAGYIALHLANFSLSNRHNNATRITTLTKEVIEVIQKTMKKDLKLDSLEYARISMHLKYLGERIFRNEPISNVDTTYDIRKMLKDDPRLSMCINRIVDLILKKYNYDLSPDEQTYLCVHIKRNMNSE
ncbi:MAG: PRD domain-containing protein [Coprobacillus sp.]|nr:PRD domain-containing protein [Coprobacillus sp.]